MKPLSRIALAILICLASSAVFGRDYKEVFPERSTTGPNLQMLKKDQASTFQWLVSEQLPITHETMLRVTPTEGSVEEINRVKVLHKKMKVGVTENTSLPVNFKNISPGSVPATARLHAKGLLRATVDGGMVWGIGVESPNATALRVHFSNVNLPRDTALYIYNLDGEAYGPYTDRGPNGDGDFWSNTVSGSIAFLQLRHFGPVSASALADTAFMIQEVAHIGGNFKVPFYRGVKPIHQKSCSFNADCVEDGSCFGSGDWGAIDDVRDGVAHILFASGPFLYICSGGLIADTDTGTEVPLFLTANHCISQSNEASSMEAFWMYRTNVCDGTCYDPDGAVPSTNGATIRATNSTSDYTIMELSQNPPSGSVYLGWNSTPVANNNGFELYRLSHPQGAPQAYSEHEVDTGAPTCGGWPRGNWIYSRDTVGATEGGSSGSPVLNVSGQIVGQLTGACGFNVNDPCDSESNATVDGAFAAYFDDVADILDPEGEPPMGGFTLSANGYKVQGKHTIDLSWSGASGSNVDIYRNSSNIATTANDGAYTDATNNRGKGTYVYQVCEAGTSTCSNSVTVSF